MTFLLKQAIENIANQAAPGPSPTFKKSHIFYALELMSEKPVGRNKLAKQLNVGGGAIRTIINRLRQADLIETTKTGCSLTSKGRNMWKTFAEHFPIRGEIGAIDLIKTKHNYAFLIKDSGQKVKSGIEQRDAAVVAGAQRAVIIVCRKGRLVIESVSEDLEAQFPRSANQILKSVQPEDNDVIIIVGAKSLVNAKHGAFAASWTLLSDGT